MKSGENVAFLLHCKIPTYRSLRQPQESRKDWQFSIKTRLRKIAQLYSLGERFKKKAPPVLPTKLSR